MTYTELKKEYVIQNLGNGETVILCDFETKRMIDCKDLKVSEIQVFIEKTETKFFKGEKK